MINAKNVFVTLTENTKSKGWPPLPGFWREKEVFLFFEKDKSGTRLAIAQKAHALFKEPQNNRELTK